MFNKSTLLFCALVASTVVAVPIPHAKSKPAPAAAAPLVAAAQVAAGCNQTLVTDNIAQMKEVANEILSVGFVLPDPFRQNAKDSATFDTVVTAIDDADKSAAAGDFATASGKIAFVSDTVSSLLDGKVADGLESSIDLELADLADETKSALAACAAPGGAAAAAPAAAAPATEPVAADVDAPIADEDVEDVADVAGSAGVCDASALTDNIAQMKDVANEILSVGFVLPDPFRQNAKDSATFDTVVTALDDADKAVAASDFATASTKITLVSDTVGSLLDGKVADGLESSIDLQLADLAADAEKLVAACT